MVVGLLVVVVVVFARRFWVVAFPEVVVFVGAKLVLLPKCFEFEGKGFVGVGSDLVGEDFSTNVRFLSMCKSPFSFRKEK